MSDEHPVKQMIASIEQDDGGSYTVGRNGITRMEATVKSGEYSFIPYVRVWAGDMAIAEFCQHKLAGVFFGPTP